MRKNAGISLGLVVSFCLHSALFLPFPLFTKYIFPKKNATANIEVNYVKIPATKKVTLKNTEEIAIKKTAAPAPALKPVAPKLLKPVAAAYKKSIPEAAMAKIPTLPAAKSFNADMKKSQDYIDYYSQIREKIRQQANNMAHAAEGDVFLIFSITDKGELHRLEVVDEASVNNPQLKDAAQQSIRLAAPFPPLPKQISSGELTFNLIISYEAKGGQNIAQW